MEKPKDPQEFPTENTPIPTEPELGGAKRTTEPTRYNDWEINGKCVDF